MHCRFWDAPRCGLHTAFVALFSARVQRRKESMDRHASLRRANGWPAFDCLAKDTHPSRLPIPLALIASRIVIRFPDRSIPSFPPGSQHHVIFGVFASGIGPHDADQEIIVRVRQLAVDRLIRSHRLQRKQLLHERRRGFTCREAEAFADVRARGIFRCRLRSFRSPPHDVQPHLERPSWSVVPDGQARKGPGRRGWVQGSDGYVRPVRRPRSNGVIGVSRRLRHGLRQPTRGRSSCGMRPSRATHPAATIGVVIPAGAAGAGGCLAPGRSFGFDPWLTPGRRDARAPHHFRIPVRPCRSAVTTTGLRRRRLGAISWMAVDRPGYAVPAWRPMSAWTRGSRGEQNVAVSPAGWQCADGRTAVEHGEAIE